MDDGAEVFCSGREDNGMRVGMLWCLILWHHPLLHASLCTSQLKGHCRIHWSPDIIPLHASLCIMFSKLHSGKDAADNTDPLTSSPPACFTLHFTVQQTSQWKGHCRLQWSSDIIPSCMLHFAHSAVNFTVLYYLERTLQNKLIPWDLDIRYGGAVVWGETYGEVHAWDWFTDEWTPPQEFATGGHCTNTIYYTVH